MTNLPQIGADDFARRFSMRAPSVMWLLGAGASASAGVPTAEDMIWEFKQHLFVSQRKVSPQTVADLSSPFVRDQLQAHIGSSGAFPKPGESDEYAALFESVYPAESDRRTYLDGKLSGAKPSYGHLALATLMRAQVSRLVWTTNFDALIADACAKVYGTTAPLTTVTLDAPDLAKECVNTEHWPLEVKLHGDFRSRRLKNTSDELRQQDARLRKLLVQCCSRFGLVVVGYSGRDSSVMESLEEILGGDNPFPSGLFWLRRGEGAPSPRVAQLLTRAAQAGVEAALVSVENFDEILRDVIRLLKDVDTQALDSFAVERRRWTPAPTPAGNRTWPVIRLNAIPLVQTPTVCRRIVCSIGGFAQAREAVKRANVDVLVARTRAGVLAFGRDGDVRRAFSTHGITDFDLQTIAVGRLRYESGERGLLRDALTRAIAHQVGLTTFRRRSADLMAPADPKDATWEPLSNLVGTIHGTVNGNPELRWREGISTRLDWANERLWLLIEPRTVFDGLTQDNRVTASAFARERTVKRYNRTLNELIDYWAHLLSGSGAELRALGIADGVDATFRLSGATGFSRRASA